MLKDIDFGLIWAKMMVEDEELLVKFVRKYLEECEKTEDHSNGKSEA